MVELSQHSIQTLYEALERVSSRPIFEFYVCLPECFIEAVAR